MSREAKMNDGRMLLNVQFPTHAQWRIKRYFGRSMRWDTCRMHSAWKTPGRSCSASQETGTGFCCALCCFGSRWRHQKATFSGYWPFVREIHPSPVNSPYKGQWRGALMFSLICAWINGWVNNREAGDLKRHRAHDDVIVMWLTDLGRLCESFPIPPHPPVLVHRQWDKLCDYPKYRWKNPEGYR